MSKKLRIGDATSFADGIKFHSKENEGYIAKVTRLEDGTILKRYGREKKISPKKSLVQNLIARAGAIALMAVFGFVVFGVAHLLKLDHSVRNGLMLFSLTVFCLTDYLFIVFKRRKTTEGQSTYRLRSAGHMAVNAFKKLQRVPTLAEVKQFSRFSIDCHTNAMTFQTILFLFLSYHIAFPQEGLTSFVITLSGGFLILLLYLTGKLNFMQYLTTFPPSDEELEVAIAGIQIWYDHEIAES